MNSSESFFNLVDYIYIAVMLTSSLFGLANGFTRTLLSLFSWVGSGFAAAMATPHVYEFLETHFSPEPMAGQLIASTSSYVICLILLTIISYFISDAVKNSMFSGLDRSLGLLFGLIRGLCIPAGVIAVLIALSIPKEKFQIVDESKISTLLYKGLHGMVPTLDIPNIKKNNEEVFKKYYEHSQKKMQQKMEKEAKKAATFKIKHPEHHSLGAKVKIIESKKTTETKIRKRK